MGREGQTAGNLSGNHAAGNGPWTLPRPPRHQGLGTLASRLELWSLWNTFGQALPSLCVEHSSTSKQVFARLGKPDLWKSEFAKQLNYLFCRIIQPTIRFL